MQHVFLSALYRNDIQVQNSHDVTFLRRAHCSKHTLQILLNSAQTANHI